MSTVKVEFLTRNYTVAHGHVPQGMGSWAFVVDGGTEQVWKHQKTYSDAKRELTQEIVAKCKQANYAGVVYVEVLT